MDRSKKIEEQKNIIESNFLKLIDEVNKGLIDGYLDVMFNKLKIALDYYEDEKLEIDIPNIFNYATNIIEGVSDRALLIEQLMRIIQLSIKNNNIDTLGSYYRYYALSQAIYGAIDTAFKIIEVALPLFKEKTPYSIELYNVKAIIYTMNNQHHKSLELLKEMFEITKETQYKPGYRYVLNIGVGYKNIGDYKNAILYMQLGIKYCKQFNYWLNQIMGLFDLTEVYVEMKEYNKASEILDELAEYDVVKTNSNYKMLYAKNRYLSQKAFGKFDEALIYHEQLLNIEKEIKNRNFDSIINELNYKFELNEKEFENQTFKNKNDQLQIMSGKLNNTNKFLKLTLKKAHDIQSELIIKNHELEIAMDNLNSTQEQLMNEKKRTILNEMVINVADNMNTPLGVMNTATSHIKRYTDLTYKKYKDNKMGKKDIEKYFLEIKKSIDLYEKSMFKLIDFIEAMKDYKVEDEADVIEIIVLNNYLEDKKEFWFKTFGLNDINIIYSENVEIKIKLTLLNKCFDILIRNILKNTLRKGFDIEISEENNMISIGLGDFTDTLKLETYKKLETNRNDYDFHIVRTIAEELLCGRFIQFEESGKEFYQIIFPKYG